MSRRGFSAGDAQAESRKMARSVACFMSRITSPASALDRAASLTLANDDCQRGERLGCGKVAGFAVSQRPWTSAKVEDLCSIHWCGNDSKGHRRWRISKRQILVMGSGAEAPAPGVTRPQAPSGGVLAAVADFHVGDLYVILAVRAARL
jgi:hypothetical protein